MRRGEGMGSPVGAVAERCCLMISEEVDEALDSREERRNLSWC